MTSSTIRPSARDFVFAVVLQSLTPGIAGTNANVRRMAPRRIIRIPKKKPGAGSLLPGYRHPLGWGIIGLLPSYHLTRFSCLSHWTKVQPPPSNFHNKSRLPSLLRTLRAVYPYSRRFPRSTPVSFLVSASTPAITSNNSSSILFYRSQRLHCANHRTPIPGSANFPAQIREGVAHELCPPPVDAQTSRRH
jgi:hypothetical protein